MSAGDVSAGDVWITPDADVRILNSLARSAIRVALVAGYGPIAVGLAYAVPGPLTPGGDLSALLLEGDMADDILDGIVLEGDMVSGVLLLEGDMA